MNFIGCENDNFQIFFFFHFCSDFFQSFFFFSFYLCSKHRLWVHVKTARVRTIYISKQNTPPPPPKKKKKKTKTTTTTNNVYPCYCKPSFVHFFSFRCFIQGSDFPFFFLECIKASFYIYLSCKCVRFNAKKSMIKFDVNTKFDFTTFIPISKLIDNDACQVFI